MSKWMTKNKYKPDKGEPVLLPSETQQGMVPSLEDVIKKYQNGMPIGYNPNLIWQDHEAPLPEFLDILDIVEAKESIGFLEAKIKEARKRVAEVEKQRQNASKVENGADSQA